MSANQHNLPSQATTHTERQQNDSSSGLVPGGVSIFARREAYAHGVIVDVTEAAKACGFQERVAFTEHVWTGVMPSLYREGETITAALHEVLRLAWLALRLDPRPKGDHEVHFCGQGSNGALVWLKVRILDLEDGSQELTVMAKDEN